MRRRQFMLLLGGASVASLRPPRATAQTGGKVPRIGILTGPTSGVVAGNYQSFLAQLRELGLNEGQQFTIEQRDVTDARGPVAAAADLMRTQPDLIVVTGPEAALQAVVGASRSVPIVFLAVQYDPIARGYVTSLARPGGNITGVFLRQLELAAKQVEILVQTFPQRTRLAILFDAFTADQHGEAEHAARAMKVQHQSLKLEKPPYDFAAAFREARAGGADMALVLSSPHFTRQAPQIAEQAKAHRLPSMFTFQHYVEAGGLMSYGVDFPQMFRKTADYVARILQGAKPADLPVEQATKFETVVNLKTAGAIGVELPTSILLRADRVIE